MLPSQHRLRRRSEFEIVYSRGRRFQSRYLALRAYRDTKSPLRIGITVSLKVSKRAVIRNRIRRQIRAVLRQCLSQLDQCWQLVISVRPGADACSYWQLEQELKTLLTDAEVLHGD
ncbi:ribonuclease P protein component [Leptolyngbya sp. FACHB-261]|uniref:ribonuclease P protein component n=1 Tax=Leptolyngbya sp. FACHB-261 TaxID=2692806 RepID=UPI0016896052|nr:ribonuclease P protein component [Leptolyngbya sp. FACHB-261]MBD2103847.1 ribonuclease P protein component [Leptolyngbya sp. FACHB-261]